MNRKYDEYFFNYGEKCGDVKLVNDKLESIRKSGYFNGKNNAKIYYEKYHIENEKGRIVICHGFTEFIEKFREITYYFLEMGYSVYIMEHRGHGRSGSLGKIDKSQVNVEKFDYYIEDFKTFLDKLVVENEIDLYLYAHSMGGGIGVMLLEKYPQYFKKAILSTPMMEIDTGKYPLIASKIISSIFVRIGKGDRYVFGQGPFDGKYNFNEAATSNEYRYKLYFDESLKDDRLQRSGASFRWLYESLNATEEILKAENVSKINIPILLFQAGRDTLVKDKGHEKFIKLCKNCKKVRFENGKHELYMENDEILTEYLREVKEFLEK